MPGVRREDGGGLHAPASAGLRVRRLPDHDHSADGGVGHRASEEKDSRALKKYANVE